MQKNLLQFFNKTDKYELPDKWVSDPLPPPAKKRCVGRPRKLGLPDARKSSDAKDDVEDTGVAGRSWTYYYLLKLLKL